MPDVVQPWPFEWPPAPGARLDLWLPESPAAAVAAVRERLGLPPAGTDTGPAALRVRDRVATATVRRAHPYRGGTVVHVDLERKGWIGERPTFDSLRYPIAFLLGTAFVISLGFGPPVPLGIYRGCVALMIVSSLIMCGMWAIAYHRQAKQNALRAEIDLDALGLALAQAGARPLPPTDNPFRR